MLNKTMPYKNIIMVIDAKDVENTPEPILPEGYSFRFFQEGDEKNWARIATSVGEFPNEQEAEDSFVRDHFHRIDDLKKRCLFVIDPDGLAVATAMAWNSDTDRGHVPYVNWVSALPGYQGKGLGKAIVMKVLRIFAQIEPGKDIILHTQTWSDKAVVLYNNLGFKIVKTWTFVSLRDHDKYREPYPNEYKEALEVLKDYIEPKKLREITDKAIDWQLR